MQWRGSPVCKADSTVVRAVVVLIISSNEVAVAVVESREGCRLHLRMITKRAEEEKEHC